MGDMEIPDELIDQLLGEYEGPEQLTGPDGLINQLRKRLIERAAGAELEQHLGYPAGGEPPEGQPNRRNGVASKTLRTVDGPVTVELPRDRDASFEPRIVPKHARSFDGFDEQILALYAGGMTTREIQRHLRELYGVDVSDGLISEVTASIQDDVRAWQSRPLEELYVVVYLDAMQVAIRDQQVVRKKAVYVAIGVTLEGDARLPRPLDREDRGRPLLDERADRTAQPRRQGRPLCLHRRPHRLPRGDRRRLPAGGQPDLHRPPRPPEPALPLLEGTQDAAPPSCDGSTPPPTPTRPARCSTSSPPPGPTARPAPPRCRSGSAPGTASSPSSPSPKRSAASSTRPTPSRACTCRSARRSRPAATSPTTTPRSD